ncbi:hypothetical protein CC86DRAFT_299144, partial [Ophiobolus disseminans]
TRRNYGAVAVEEADERLQEEVSIRHQQARAQAPPPLDREQLVRGELADTNDELAEARRRREFLEKEPEAARVTENTLVRKKTMTIEHLKSTRKLKQECSEKERKRQVAFKKRDEDRGATPAGVRKVVVQASKSPVKSHGLRLAKKDGK